MTKTLTLFVLLSSFLITAQVGIGTSTPSDAAVLDINAQISSGNYGGLKLPTINEADKASIVGPIPDGLMIYVVDGLNRCLQMWDSNLVVPSWINVHCMNRVPVVTIVDYTGTLELGSVLNSSYTYNDQETDAESGTSFQWYQADDASGTNRTPIPSGTNATYTITATDIGKFIAVGVTPGAISGASPGQEVLSIYREIELLQTLIDFDLPLFNNTSEDSSFIIPIVLTNPSPGDTSVTVAYNSSSVIGILGTDYDIEYNGSNITSFPFVVTFSSGSSNESFVFHNYAIDNNSANERLILDLTTPIGGTNAILGTRDQVDITVLDNESPTSVSLDATFATINEYNAPASQTVSISIQNPSTTRSTTVDVIRNITSSTELGDYVITYDGATVSLPFTVTFAPGQITAEVFTVDALYDVDTANESLRMNLTNLSGGIDTSFISGSPQFTLNIIDDVLIYETFETDGSSSRYTLSDTDTPSDRFDYFRRTNNSGIDPNFSNADGFFFAAQDLDDAMGNIIASNELLTFNSVNASGFRTFNYSIDLAEDDDGINQDWDTDDYFRIDYRIDGGGWFFLFRVNGTAANTEPQITTNVGGANVGANITSVFQTFTGSFTAAPTSNIQFRLAFRLNDNNEDIAVDNFIVY